MDSEHDPILFEYLVDRSFHSSVLCNVLNFCLTQKVLGLCAQEIEKGNYGIGI